MTEVNRNPSYYLSEPSSSSCLAPEADIGPTGAMEGKCLYLILDSKNIHWYHGIIKSNIVNIESGHINYNL